MSGIRWWLFKRLCAIGWRICPEPHRSRLQYVMPRWDDVSLERVRLDIDRVYRETTPEQKGNLRAFVQTYRTNASQGKAARTSSEDAGGRDG